MCVCVFLNMLLLSPRILGRVRNLVEGFPLDTRQIYIYAWRQPTMYKCSQARQRVFF